MRIAAELLIHFPSAADPGVLSLLWALPCCAHTQYTAFLSMVSHQTRGGDDKIPSAFVSPGFPVAGGLWNGMFYCYTRAPGVNGAALTDVWIQPSPAVVLIWEGVLVNSTVEPIITLTVLTL